MTFRETALCAALVLAGCSHPKSDASPATDDTSTPSSTASLAGNVAMGADALFRDDAAVVEGFDEGTAAFTIAPDGAVKVAVADAAGKPVSVSDRKATLKYSILETGKTVEVPLQPDADKHYLVATGPELADVVTPVKYEITGGARPWTGILQIPAGGTKALNASAQVAADAHAAPIVGPHGGHIERVGKDDVELLLDKDSGETRAWIIVDGKAVEPNDRELVVLIDDKRVKLRADRNMSFYGKVKPELGLHLDAIHKVSCELTVGVGASAKVNTVLFGMRPHVLVYAPRVIVDIEVDDWTKTKRAKWVLHPEDDDDDFEHHHHHHGDDEDDDDQGDHGRHRGHHKGVDVIVDVPRPEVHVEVPRPEVHVHAGAGFGMGRGRGD